METEGKILIGVKNGQIGVRVQITKITQAELSMLITHLDIIKDDLKLRYKKGIKQI